MIPTLNLRVVINFMLNRDNEHKQIQLRTTKMRFYLGSILCHEQSRSEATQDKNNAHLGKFKIGIVRFAGFNQKGDGIFNAALKGNKGDFREECNCPRLTSHLLHFQMLAIRASNFRQ